MAPNFTGSRSNANSQAKKQKLLRGCFPCPYLLLRLSKRFRQCRHCTSSASHPNSYQQNVDLPRIPNSSEHIPIPSASTTTQQSNTIPFIFQQLQPHNCVASSFQKPASIISTIPASSHQTSDGSIISSLRMVPSHVRKQSEDWEIDHHSKKVVWREGLLQNLGRLHGSGFCRLSLGELIDLHDDIYLSQSPNGNSQLDAHRSSICNPLPLIPSASPPPFPSNSGLFVAEIAESEYSGL